jgi:hypothetical protein
MSTSGIGESEVLSTCALDIANAEFAMSEIPMDLNRWINLDRRVAVGHHIYNASVVNQLRKRTEMMNRLAFQLPRQMSLILPLEGEVEPS